uniref:Uncharacterized protein n=1 Tax=Anguilla anguilla TaxID=7936 RepID=A0A0E9XVK0_ANGAN
MALPTVQHRGTLLLDRKICTRIPMPLYICT